MTDIRTLEESVRMMNSAERQRCEAILLGDSFITAKNLYMSLDSAARCSIIEVLIAERDRLWCRVALSIMVYCIVWYLVPSDGDKGFSLSLMFGMFSFGIFWPVIVIFTILGIFTTLRVKNLRALSNEDFSDVSDVQD